ncbi:MAG: glycoside hydrolase, partial [Pedobacter sp.]
TYTFRLAKDGKVTYSTQPAAFNTTTSKSKGVLHTKDDWSFQFDNGEAFRGIGENICWESRDNDDSKYFKALHENPKYNYEYMLPALANHGGNYFRTWICSWNLPLDWKSGFNNRRYENSSAYFNPSAISKMDRMVNLSDSLGLYIMLTMGPGSYDTRNGRYQTSTADFFTDAKAKAQYKNRLRFIVARWGYSPAIGAWEFFNEIDNVQFRDKNNPIPAENIVQWHQEMADYLKALDPFHHLITTSISHRDLKGLNSIGAIDFNQKHIYKDNRALPTTILSYASQFKKPYVIGEYGYEYDWSKNFDEFAPEMDSDFKRGLWYGLFSPTPILPLSWWWEYFDNRGTDKYIAKVRTIQDLMMKAGKGSFEKMEMKSANPDVETFSVKCGNDIFVYLYNPKKEAATTEILLPAQQNYALTKYTCETGTFDKEVSVKNSSKIAAVALNPNADVVYILKQR